MSAVDPAGNDRESKASVSWSIEDHDKHAAVTVVAMLKMFAAFAMAVFGLPPIDVHGPFHQFGIMDPFCGGTRAARYTAAGNLEMGWKYNPLGIVVGGGAVVARSLVGLTTRWWLTPTVGWTKQGRRAVLIIAAVLVIVLEVRQQMFFGRR